MVDFGVSPPEVTSAQMYAGAGSGPMVAAAAAWDQLAATLGSAAGSYRSVVSELTAESWQGPASAAMAAAANPYVEWINATAVQATATANQVRAAAAAYEAAHAAVVPPPVIAANRTALSSLVAGNVLGQNSAAIAANQAEYGQMWAQDAAAMQAYAAGAAAATKPLPAFSPPPQTANPAAGQTGAAQAAAAAPAQGGLTDLLNSNPLEALLNSPLVSGFEQLFNSQAGLMVGGIAAPGFDAASIMLGGPNFPVNGAIAASQVFAAVAAGTPELASSTSSEPGATPFTLAGAHAPGVGAAGVGAASAPGGMGSVGREVLAGVGNAAPVGELSVPPSWNAATPQGIRLAANAIPTTGFPASPSAAIATRGGFLGGMPAVVGVVNAPRKAKAAKGRPDPGSEATGRTAAAGRGGDDARHRSPEAADDRAVTSGRTELERLRRAVAEMTQRRDSLEETAAMRIAEATRS